MLSGKAIARAVRGHFIVDAALNTLMLHSGFNAHLPCQTMSCSSDGEADVEASTKNQNVDEALTLYERLMAGEISAEEVCSFNVLERIKDSLKNHLKKSSRTSAFWVQYMARFNSREMSVGPSSSSKWMKSPVSYRNERGGIYLQE